MSSAEPLSKILIQYILAGGPAWTPLIGYLLILYGYLVSETYIQGASFPSSSSSKRKSHSREMDSLSNHISTLWTIMCCLALAGTANVFIESSVIAVNKYDPSQNWLGMMAFGVVFSLIEEACVMLYFIVKLIAALPNHGFRTVIKAFLYLCYALYASGRIWETALKIQYNLVEVSSVNQVNLPTLETSVFLFSIAYLLLNAGLMVLLVQACRPSVQKKTAKKTVKSSVFSRIFLVPLVNMLMPLAFILSYLIYSNGQVLGETMQNFLQILSALQCAVPIFLLFDMMSTEDFAITEVINSQILEEATGQKSHQQSSTSFQTFESFRASSQISESDVNMHEYMMPLRNSTARFVSLNPSNFSSHRDSYSIASQKGVVSAIDQEKRESIPAWQLTMGTTSDDARAPLSSPLPLEHSHTSSETLL